MKLLDLVVQDNILVVPYWPTAEIADAGDELVARSKLACIEAAERLRLTAAILEAAGDVVLVETSNRDLAADASRLAHRLRTEHGKAALIYAAREVLAELTATLDKLHEAMGELHKLALRSAPRENRVN
jgi:hypothetical protein